MPSKSSDIWLLEKHTLAQEEEGEESEEEEERRRGRGSGKTGRKSTRRRMRRSRCLHLGASVPAGAGVGALPQLRRARIHVEESQRAVLPDALAVVRSLGSDRHVYPSHPVVGGAVQPRVGAILQPEMCGIRPGIHRSWRQKRGGIAQSSCRLTAARWASRACRRRARSGSTLGRSLPGPETAVFSS